MEDIANFLGLHPPFDALDTGDLARVAAETEMESFPAGKTIFSQGAGPVARRNPRRLHRPQDAEHAGAVLPQGGVPAVASVQSGLSTELSLGIRWG